jgi:molybdenum cofactor biosynthesis enzyme
VIKAISYLVYQDKNNDLQKKKARKEDVIATATHNLLPNVSKNVENYMDICHAISGAHIEIW